jgi:hypothetical protein
MHTGWPKLLACMLNAMAPRRPDWMLPRQPYWLRAMCGAGILLTIGAGNKIVPVWLGLVGFILLVAFFAVVVAWVLQPLLARFGLWRRGTEH